MVAHRCCGHHPAHTANAAQQQGTISTRTQAGNLVTIGNQTRAGMGMPTGQTRAPGAWGHRHARKRLLRVADTVEPRHGCVPQRPRAVSAHATVRVGEVRNRARKRYTVPRECWLCAARVWQSFWPLS